MISKEVGKERGTNYCDVINFSLKRNEKKIVAEAEKFLSFYTFLFSVLFLCVEGK